MEALSYLHSPTHGDPPRGYVHSDIKPANLMRTPDNNIYLIDFNIALALGEENVIGCSIGYASPEHYGLDFSSNYDTVTPTSGSWVKEGVSRIKKMGTDKRSNKTEVMEDPASVALPFAERTVWLLPDGTDITELPWNLDYSVMVSRQEIKENSNPVITTTTKDFIMDDVVRVKYVPYSYTVETDNSYEGNTVTFSIESGRLAEGLMIYPATGEI